ncbi:hypothetical protein HanOQP8_Chr08g0281181 [Helianthus annuus]|nr:hypothetical protein HanOQP8_Chr08g0281181 [Helianthus annuus]
MREVQIMGSSQLLIMDRRQHLCVGHTLMDQRLKRSKFYITSPAWHELCSSLA